jgi:hypothetical protein
MLNFWTVPTAHPVVRRRRSFGRHRQTRQRCRTCLLPYETHSLNGCKCWCRNGRTNRKRQVRPQAQRTKSPRGSVGRSRSGHPLARKTRCCSLPHSQQPRPRHQPQAPRSDASRFKFAFLIFIFIYLILAASSRMTVAFFKACCATGLFIAAASLLNLAASNTRALFLAVLPSW